MEKFPVLLLKGTRKKKKKKINPLVLFTNSEVHEHSYIINVESTPVYTTTTTTTTRPSPFIPFYIVQIPSPYTVYAIFFLSDYILALYVK
jgi:hypothetical protein